MRKAEIQRDTKETQVQVAVDLDGRGESSLASGIPFLDHNALGAVEVEAMAAGCGHAAGPKSRTSWARRFAAISQ